jgi:hypothetical protein
MRLSQACAPSITAALALAVKYPSLRIVAQLADDASDAAKDAIPATVRVERRGHGGVQKVTDAVIYLVRLHLVSRALSARIQAELLAHLGVLSANSSATLILAPRLLPEPGSVDAKVEAMARLSDLSRQQLMNSHDLELDELTNMVNAVYDIRGGLVVVNRLTSTDGRPVAVGVKYQNYSAGFAAL